MKPKNYAKEKSILPKCEKIYAQLLEGYSVEKKDQNDRIIEYWDIYNGILGENQQYDGNAKVFEPIVHDAIEARRKRFTGMTFPSIGNNVECVSMQGDNPQATLAVLQRHIRKTDLRAVVSSLFLNGDVEGQWSLMLDWRRSERKITKKTRKDVEGTTEEIEDIEEEIVVDESPQIEVIPAQDLWIFPATVFDVQDAEIVSVALRLTEDALDDMVERGLIVQSALDKMFSAAENDKIKWAAKERAKDAGIRIKGGKKFALVYQVFTKLKLDGERTPAIIFFGGENTVLGIIKNPHWSKKIPVISVPVDRVAGSIWGKSKIQAVAPLQYQLNDITNMGMDSAQFSVMPIVFTDPLKNPNYASMTLAMAAIWPTSPNDTRIAQFPALYEHAMNIRGMIKSQIMESLDVNEVMLGASPRGRKNASAVGQQSMEAMTTIGDVVKRFEFGVMDRILEWFYEMDLQYREDEVLVEKDGEHGIKAILEAIPPQQITNRYWFKWNGAEQATGPQRVQQMIGLMNVLRGLPPNVLNGRRLDLGPMLDLVVQATCGPTLAQNLLIDQRHEISVPADVENEMLHNNLPVAVSPLDEDVSHIKEHQEAARVTGDKNGLIRAHIVEHTKAIQKKMQEAKPQGYPGIPGGGAQPGVAGTPRPGAMPGQPRAVQGPPGQIHADQLIDGQARG